MTLSTFLILYVVGVVISFLLSPKVLGVDNPKDLLVMSLLFPLFWGVSLAFIVWNRLEAIAQMYIDFLEKRNEKNR